MIVISQSLFNRYFDKPLSLQNVVQTLNNKGFEAELDKEIFQNVQNIRIAEIVDVQPHPHAEKLGICSVRLPEITMQVICGDIKNLIKGNKVAFAVPNTYIPSQNNIIKSKKIRGVVSNGMLCSLKELNLGTDCENIWILPKNSEVGASIETQIQSDPLVRIHPPRNRTDCNSFIGMIQEIAGLFAITPSANTIEPYINPNIAIPKIKIHPHSGCHRYSILVIQNIQWRPTPKWICKALETNDLRVLNTPADIGQFIMLEHGVPPHVFDRDTLLENTIHVRKQKISKFFGLNHQTYMVEHNDIVVENNGRCIAIAGIIGDMQTAVSSQTKNVLLEFASFSSTNIRSTSQRLRLETKAALRFMQNPPETNIDPAITRCTTLMQNIYGGIVSATNTQKITTQDKKKLIISISLDLINKRTGIKTSAQEIQETLNPFGFVVSCNSNKNTLNIHPPIQRQDIVECMDIVAEITRLLGNQRIEPEYHLPSLNPNLFSSHSPFIFQMRDAISNIGFSEIQTSSFQDSNAEKALNRHTNAGFKKNLNPKRISPINVGNHTMYLRNSLLVNMFALWQSSLGKNHKEFFHFETGKIFFETLNAQLYEEQQHLALGMHAKNKDFFHLKGFVNHILSLCIQNIDSISFAPAKQSELGYPETHFFSKTTLTKILLNSHLLGIMGNLNLTPNKSNKFQQIPSYCELNIDILQHLCTKYNQNIQYQKVSIYPSMSRDLTVDIPKNIPFSSVLETIKNTTTSYLKKIHFQDSYSPPNHPDLQCMTFKLLFVNPKETLSFEQTHNDFVRIAHQLQLKLGGTIRGL